MLHYTHLHSWNTCRGSWKYVNCSEFLSSVSRGSRLPRCADRSRVLTRILVPTVYRLLQVLFIRVRKNCEKRLLSSSYLYVCVSVRLDQVGWKWTDVNSLTPNDPYRGRTSPLNSKCCILYIYSTNIGTEYFKRGIHSPFFPLQIAVCFIILTYLVPVLFTFYIQGVIK